MNIEAWQNFWFMGGHGIYVWSSYGLTTIVLLWNIIAPLRQRRLTVNTVKRLIRRSHHSSEVE